MPAPLRYVQDSADFPDAVDVVIIGAGIAGAAAAWELTKKGLKVALLEKGLVGAEQSSRNWGWCRQQNRDERELPLIIYALQRWGELGEETGEELGFRRSGLIYATRSEADIAAWERWNRMAKNYDVQSEILTADRAKAMTPGSTSRWLGGVSSPTDGHAEPRLAAPGLAIAAQRLGARIFQQCAVRGLDIAAGRVSGVWTERGLIKTSRVISPSRRRSACRSIRLASPAVRSSTAAIPSPCPGAAAWSRARRASAMRATSILFLRAAVKICA